MANPTPISLQILDQLVVVLSAISVADGYFTDAGANVGIEPINFDGRDAGFVGVVVEEESANIVDSNQQIFREESIFCVNGLIYAPNVRVGHGQIRTAHKLRDDITVALKRTTQVTFKTASGIPFADKFQLLGKREILLPPENEALVQVKVRVSIRSSQVLPQP